MQPQEFPGMTFIHAGKVRRMYRLDDDHNLLGMYATDQISTHNVVHLTPIPLKGEILTAQTVFFAREVLTDIPTHLVASGEGIFDYLDRDRLPPGIEKRLLIVRAATPIPREFVWRNRLAGSLARDLASGKDPYDLYLGRDLPLMHPFSPPLLTPTMKSADDEPVKTRHVKRQFPSAVALTEEAVEQATKFLAARGIDLIDTKLETDGVMLVDEFFTGDSSRFARSEEIELGKNPGFLDKEPIRKVAEYRWDGGPKVPLSFTTAETAEGIHSYHVAFEMISGMKLPVFQKDGLNHLF
jgi:phosphoribosylaminoimidazole-succinocarboxamide synthase